MLECRSLFLSNNTFYTITTTDRIECHIDILYYNIAPAHDIIIYYSDDISRMRAALQYIVKFTMALWESFQYYNIDQYSS